MPTLSRCRFDTAKRSCRCIDMPAHALVAGAADRAALLPQPTVTCDDAEQLCLIPRVSSDLLPIRSRQGDDPVAGCSSIRCPSSLNAAGELDQNASSPMLRWDTLRPLPRAWYRLLYISRASGVASRAVDEVDAYKAVPESTVAELLAGVPFAEVCAKRVRYKRDLHTTVQPLIVNPPHHECQL